MPTYPESLEFAARVLDDLQASDLKVLSLGKISSIADYFVIATGNSAPHLKALASEVESRLDTAGIKALRRAGDPGSGWVILDYADVILHLMTPDLRSFYALEQLWSDGETVPYPFSDASTDA